MKVYLLTIEQKNLIEGVEFSNSNYFNATQDKNNNWFISVEEVEQCVNEEYMWVKNLPLIDYEPLITDII